MIDANGVELAVGDLVVIGYRVRKMLDSGECIIADDKGRAYGVKSSELARVSTPENSYSGTVTGGLGETITISLGNISTIVGP